MLEAVYLVLNQTGRVLSFPKWERQKRNKEDSHYCELCCWKRCVPWKKETGLPQGGKWGGTVRDGLSEDVTFNTHPVVFVTWSWEVRRISQGCLPGFWLKLLRFHFLRRRSHWRRSIECSKWTVPIKCKFWGALRYPSRVVKQLFCEYGTWSKRPRNRNWNRNVI